MNASSEAKKTATGRKPRNGPEKPKKVAGSKSGPPKPTRRAAATGKNSTRQELVDATIETIYEAGLGNTSSPEVARRIGASWSVIQYYFGSWEALLLEAVKQISDRNYEVINRAVIAGETVADRLTAYSNTVFEIYSHGQYGVITQIGLHLLANPKTHESTLAMINHIVTRQDRAMVGLLGQVSPALAKSVELRNLVSYSLAGLAMALEVSRVLYRDVPAPERRPNEKQQRALLVQAIALLLESGRRSGSA